MLKLSIISTSEYWPNTDMSWWKKKRDQQYFVHNFNKSGHIFHNCYDTQCNRKIIKCTTTTSKWCHDVGDDIIMTSFKSITVQDSCKKNFWTRSWTHELSHLLEKTDKFSFVDGVLVAGIAKLQRQSFIALTVVHHFDGVACKNLQVNL